MTLILLRRHLVVRGKKMNEDLSFYLSFAGFSVGVLALICTLVLLFGRGGARKILGWTFGLVIIGTIVTVGIMWANEPRQ